MNILLKTLSILFIILLASPVYSSRVEIQFISVKARDDRIKVSFTVTSFQRKDIVEAIKRGMEVKITYEIQIIRNSAIVLITNKVVYDKMVLRSVKYDYWSKSYQIKEGKKITTLQSENSMLEYFFSLKDYELSDVDMVREENYSIRVKAELKSVNLYFPMNLIFKYLVGFWDFDTGWEKGPPINFE